MKNSKVDTEKKQQISRPFTQLGADLSLTRPAFALLRCGDEGGVELLGKCNVKKKSTDRHHGPVLDRIFNEIRDWITKADVQVRERGFSRYTTETQALFKVVGITDLAAWQSDGLTFEEIAPKSVKKIITGNGNASKADVAAALEAFIGPQEYACDDESDAVGVGVAWLLTNGYIKGRNDVQGND